MKPAEDIRKFFHRAGLSTYPETHEKVFQEMLDAQRQAIADSPARPEIWRTAMRHPITKYAIAAVLILAATVMFTLFHRTGNVSWAIEQSVEALSRYNAIFVEGLCSERAWTEDGSTARKLGLQQLKSLYEEVNLPQKIVDTELKIQQVDAEHQALAQKAREQGNTSGPTQ